jgi:ubiquinone/menaquinone biosynthesis C-methylase UbiE
MEMQMKKLEITRLSKTTFPIMSPQNAGRMVENNLRIDNIFASGRAADPLVAGELDELKKESLHLLTIMYPPKACNFKCPNYCCTEGIDKGRLDNGQILEIVRQATELGMKVTYFPGLGELPLLKKFWELQEELHRMRIASVVFTNGSAFWDDGLARTATGKSAEELIEKVNEIGMYLYVKYWHSDPKEAARMVGVRESEYPYKTLADGMRIPLALARLMERMSKDRLGVEVMVSRENYGDVVANIMPNIEKLGLYGLMEPVIFSGKAEGRQAELALTPEQYSSLADQFISGGKWCIKRQSREASLVGENLLLAMLLPPAQENRVLDNSGALKPILGILHGPEARRIRADNDRYGCVCRHYFLEKQKERRMDELFGAFAPDYIVHMDRTNHSAVQKRIMDGFIGHIGKKVLDIATGPGTIAKYVKGAKSECEVHGIDRNEKMLIEATKDPQGVEFKKGEATALPAKDGTYDTVTSSYAFYWIKDPEKAISEVGRVLKTGGTFIVLEEEFNGGDTQPVFSRYDRADLKELAGLENYIGVARVRQMIEAAGFEFVEQVQYPVDERHGTAGMAFRKR